MTAKRHSAKPVPAIGDPRIGLALGGGGARGFAHIHALIALDELGIKPVVISGSSIGALMGAGYAAGMSGKALMDFSLATLGDRGEVFSRFWKLRPKGFADMMRTGLRPGKIDIEAILQAFLPDDLPKTFEELKIPLKVTGLDFYGQCEMVFEHGTLLPALAASAAIPALFRPVSINERLYIDGGIINPVPFDHVEGQSDFVIAVDVVGGPAPRNAEKDFPPTIDLLLGTSQLMMQGIIAGKLKIHQPQVFLRPPVDAWRVMDFLKVREILNETQPFKDEVKRSVDAALAKARALDGAA